MKKSVENMPIYAVVIRQSAALELYWVWINPRSLSMPTRPALLNSASTTISRQQNAAIDTKVSLQLPRTTIVRILITKTVADAALTDAIHAEVLAQVARRKHPDRHAHEWNIATSLGNEAWAAMEGIRTRTGARVSEVMRAILVVALNAGIDRFEHEFATALAARKAASDRGRQDLTRRVAKANLKVSGGVVA
ncbi:hypothetical protein [Trinickia dabaoshanensis]|uniref:hypothetical protein n=1 Tax=Trinickia dabaoshanensis TaxID=564714 RepID=UPI0011AF09A9|nr:hypothetical protein [Trinickia dabaoshanensis]